MATTSREPTAGDTADDETFEIDEARARGAAHVVARDLRAAILRGELVPGEHIRQSYWAERLGVSRVPIREALKTLAAQDIVVHDVNRGYYVTKIDMFDMNQIRLMRRLLEPELVRTLEWPEDRVIQQLRLHVGDMRRAASTERVDAWLDAHRAVHFDILECSPLKLVVRHVERLWALSDAYRGWLLPDSLAYGGEATADLHDQMVDAIEAQDRERLLELFEHEREWSQRDVARILSS